MNGREAMRTCAQAECWGGFSEALRAGGWRGKGGERPAGGVVQAEVTWRWGSGDTGWDERGGNQLLLTGRCVGLGLPSLTTVFPET